MRLRSKIALTLALAFGCHLFWPLPQRAQSPEYSKVVLANEGSLLKAYLSADYKWRFATDVSALPSVVREGLLCLEDRRFGHHPGVDPLAIARAIRQNSAAGKRVSGASTLTMQVARLLEPKPRGYLNKLREAMLAFRLEAQLSKKQIMDLYLSYAPFGGNVEGLEAASRRYFNKPAARLTAADVAFLYLLPQSPRRWGSRDRVNLTALRDRNLARFEACGLVNGNELTEARMVAIPEWRGAYPVFAPHAADWALSLNEGQPDPATNTVHTSIDIDLQKTIEDLVAGREADLRATGILNLGLIAVSNATGEIRAAVGNFDASRTGDAQNFNSFLVPRSTGSLLKSFLYARLLESGDLLPETLLEDVPLDLNGYQPANYNGEFQGLVEARMALAHSLNIPWIRALKDYGVDAFMSFLLSSGLSTPQQRQDVGVSMVVGGLQANLKDMVMLYRALADDGRMMPLSLLRDPRGKKPAVAGWTWIHPAAAHLVREALKIRGRPDFAIDPRYLTNSQIRWKTGTSQGNRDAWAIGFDPDWTVGVWLGNLSEQPSPALVGPEVAAPLMFDAFSRLRARSPHVDNDWQAAGTEMVEVCAFSGLPAGPSCPHRKKVLGIKGLVMRKTCPYHQDILVDEMTGLRITRECEQPGMVPVVRPVLDLSPDVADWTATQLPGVEMAPRFHPSCIEKPVVRAALRILSPEPTNYLLRKDDGEKTLALPLRLKTASASGDWHCYLNGKPMPSVNPRGDNLVQVRPGDYSILCADEQGRSDQVDFSVEM